MTRCTLDIILETAMGVAMDNQINPDSRQMKLISRIGLPDFFWNFIPQLT
jgi:hypothetical protein